MTESLLKKLEEKVIAFVTEIDILRKEVLHLRQENADLKLGEGAHAKKLQGLVSMLDALDVIDEPIAQSDVRSFQEKREYATQAREREVGEY